MIEVDGMRHPVPWRSSADYAGEGTGRAAAQREGLTGRCNNYCKARLVRRFGISKSYAIKLSLHVYCWGLGIHENVGRRHSGGYAISVVHTEVQA